MAKKLARTLGKATRRRARRVATMPRMVNDAAARIQRHVKLLLDPCSAELGPTAYRGRDGFVSRFSGFHANADAAASCAVFLWYPRINRIYNRGVAAFTTDLGAIDFYGANSAAGPGADYLFSNAEASRCISGCLQAFYSGTELDRQGIVYQGVVPARTFSNTAAGVNTAARFTQLLQAQSRCPDSVVETKWVPSAENEEYEDTGIGSSTPHLLSGDNVVVFIASAFAVGKLNFNFRVVGNYEWLPTPGAGFMCPSPSTPDAPAGFEHVRTTIARYGKWWLDALHTAGAVYQTGRRVYQAARGVAQIAAAPAVPLLAL